ncbi:putative tail-fiber protein [Bdellovibrio phage phi1422]|uniref:tail fiber protein n=1 Tax=Bdellovibrio phage phi1422 TaxID=1127515 RepID=UPI0002536D77|nr:tail fiber protein [Bdellovibrio phage phi1422]AFC22587.1 putative tail-fiber protein [Bdellovibrio phage phi1422]
MGIKISQMDVMLNSNLTAGDSLPIVDLVSGTTKRIPIGQLDLRYQGVPDGGTTGQLLAKASSANKNVYWKSLSKSDVGLTNVDNTSDANKPISTATQNALNLKANVSTLATKADVSYVNTQLATKQDKLPNGTDGYVLTLVAGVPAWEPSGSGGGAVTSVFGRSGPAITAEVGDYDKTMIGLANVDDTSDMDKPISTATATALAGKQDLLPAGVNGQVLTLVAGSPAWATAPTGIPNGGTTGQALVKASNSNGDVTWTTIEAGVNVSALQQIADAAAITLLAVRVQRVVIEGASGPATVTMPNGTIDGQLVYIEGNSDANPATVFGIEFTADRTLIVMWNGTKAKWMKYGGN